MTCLPALPDIKTIYKALVTKTFFSAFLVHLFIDQEYRDLYICRRIKQS